MEAWTIIFSTFLNHFRSGSKKRISISRYILIEPYRILMNLIYIRIYFAYIYMYVYIRKSCWEWHEYKNSNIFLWNPWIPMKQHRLWQHEVQRSWRPRPGRTMFTAKDLGLVLGELLKWSRWFTQKQPVDIRNTALKTNMTMEKQPFKDISSMKHCDFPILVYWMANDGNIIWYQQGLEILFGIKSCYFWMLNSL